MRIRPTENEVAALVKVGHDEFATLPSGMEARKRKREDDIAEMEADFQAASRSKRIELSKQQHLAKQWKAIAKAALEKEVEHVEEINQLVEKNRQLAEENEAIASRYNSLVAEKNAAVVENSRLKATLRLKSTAEAETETLSRETKDLIVDLDAEDRAVGEDTLWEGGVWIGDLAAKMGEGLDEAATDEKPSLQ